MLPDAFLLQKNWQPQINSIDLCRLFISMSPMVFRSALKVVGLPLFNLLV
ncbi:hypothetical protein BLL52_4200 [Rhodoferax antarcticus ANT.BR]|uniref:Uncharacterized protein n=1 Tax=Rhodoferax antarcticus ANT.BR TaxID=1111071 RepID=A0A1Q8Y8Z7_9BURK|nr:hypothetical protein BLL52_4200 [Rhodoferax antarcticus ANT.BR]